MKKIVGRTNTNFTVILYVGETKMLPANTTIKENVTGSGRFIV